MQATRLIHRQYDISRNYVLLDSTIALSRNPYSTYVIGNFYSNSSHLYYNLG